MATKTNRAHGRGSNRRRTGQASKQNKRRTAGSVSRAAGNRQTRSTGQRSGQGNRGRAGLTRTSRTPVGTARKSRAKTIRSSDNRTSTSAERQHRPDVIREPIKPGQQPEIREPDTDRQEAEVITESPEAEAQAEGVARTATRQPRHAQKGAGTRRRANGPAHDQELYERTTDYRQQKRVEVDPLASTVQKAQVWLNDLMDELGTEDKHRAHQALRAVLHTLRDRLPVDEAVHLGAQLPTLIRGIYYEGWVPAGKPIKYNKQEFFNCVREYFMNLSGIDHGEVVQTVFRLLQKHISEGEIRNIQDSLPEEFADLWSEEAFATP
jgi:uncharacterized protein (DUF2267 family)